jgi:tetratricopeptide (TPR) repeat protein
MKSTTLPRLVVLLAFVSTAASAVDAVPGHSRVQPVLPVETPAERAAAQRAEIVAMEARHAAKSAVAERKLLYTPNDLGGRLEAAQAYVLEAQASPSKLDAAWEHVSAVLVADSANVEALLLAAQIESIRGQMPQAQAHYLAATRADPSNAAAFLGLGESWSRLGNEDQASQAYAEYRRLRGLAPIRNEKAVPPQPGQEPPRILGRSLETTSTSKKKK